ncbi:MAG: biopolymer transporter ExbD [Armatimonadota bacterium]|nr:MAG: biopolymer transporter ExbD [Armatimonadota bacterium]
MRIRRRPVERARIELIPMIDTMAFLLVFFMIASLAMSRQAGLPVKLPRAESAEPQTWGDRALVVTLDREGNLFLDKDPVGWGSLREQVSARLAMRPELIVVINADEELRHREVIAAMDAVKQAGAANMVIPTRPTEEQEASVGP